MDQVFDCKPNMLTETNIGSPNFMANEIGVLVFDCRTCKILKSKANIGNTA
jgi:hypothetical protein